jgi:hypothetical protein
MLGTNIGKALEKLVTLYTNGSQITVGLSAPPTTIHSRAGSTQTGKAVCGKGNASFAMPFYTKNDLFAKTGS